MDKDYEIIQNISLAETKVEENQTPQAVEAQVETASVPQVNVVEEKQVEVEQPVIPSVEFDAPVNVDGEEATTVTNDVPNIEISNNVVSVPSSPSAVSVPTSGDDIDFGALLGNFNVNFDETAGSPLADESDIYNMTANAEYSTNNYEATNYDVTNEENSSVGVYVAEDSNTSYSEPTNYSEPEDTNKDIDYKDEDSINRYYDQKTQNAINEIEKERTAALDQCKRYQEMASWVNDIGSSFNFFKGRSGY